MKAEYYPEHDARIAARLTERFPETLPPNRLMNVILDIIRGEMFDRADVVEALDQLAWAHLGVSAEWEKMLNDHQVSPSVEVPR
jgi:hypothetical protein